jgi:hypothetical protein
VGKPFFLLPYNLIDKTAGHAEGVISDDELIAVLDELGDGFLRAHSFICFFAHRNDAFPLFMDTLYQVCPDETNPILSGDTKNKMLPQLLLMNPYSTRRFWLKDRNWRPSCVCASERGKGSSIMFIKKYGQKKTIDVYASAFI